ncbi:hypothetical protein R5R35_003237 [Gryllus longicercus]|uniref:CHK kinase-like domain-containing protein n=1 Tax=Gryllus longicercus TaxID=2509291 RepID=A0AAN9VPW2_9ORTH
MVLDTPTKWIQNVIVPRILKNDHFQGASLKKTEVRALETMKDNWASDMYETNVIISHQGQEKNISFLLKLMSENKSVREHMQSEKQFFNEIHFYSTVKPLFSSQTSLPELKSVFDDFFPTCYYSYHNKDKVPQSFEDAVLVMENLKAQDFKLGNRTSLDFEHFSLVLRSLGTFHAFSYYMKERDPEKFRNIVVKPIMETNYANKNKEFINVAFNNSELRVVEAFEAESSDCECNVARLRDMASRKPFEKFMDFVRPQEPLAVLCHGDLLRNNVLFRYENGKPTEMKFIDFQTIRYASPAIDLSLLLCMNSTHELREKHFHELLKVYHTSLRKTLAALLEKPEDELHPHYSFEAFLIDFRRHAGYGYLITAEFLPWMYAAEEELSTFLKVSSEEPMSPKYIEMQRLLGGENATRSLVTLAKDLLQYQCL